MHKLKTGLVALIMITAVFSTINIGNAKAPTATVGVSEFTKYTWELDTINLQTTFIFKNMDNYPKGANYTDDLLNQLQGAKFSLSIGKIHETQQILYMVPIAIIQNDISITAEMLESIGLSPQDASKLAFTIPKGSGIVLLATVFLTNPVTPTSTLLGKTVKAIENPSILPKLNFGDELLKILANPMPGPNPQIPIIASMPYDYSNAAPPAPIVPPAVLDPFGTQWESNNQPGLTFDYSQSGDDAIYTVSGVMESNNTYMNHYQYSRAEINTFRMVYSFELGIIKELSVNVHFTSNETWYDEWEGVWRTRYYDVTINLHIGYTGSSPVEIGLQNGEKLGFKVTDLYMSPDLKDVINQTIGGGAITPENFTFFEQFIEAMRATFEYQEYNPYYYSGLDLYYDTTFENTLLNQTNTTFAIYNVYQLGAPYITPDWEVQYATFQFQQFLMLKLYPKIIKFGVENSSTNAYFDFNSQYSIYESPDNNWVTLISNITINTGFKNTIPAENEYKMDLSITFNSWMTYEKAGRLTEIGLLFSFSFVNDTNGDGSLTGEPTYSGTAKIIINRVQNTGGPTGTPNYDQPINAPEPSSDWTETTPEKTTGTTGGGEAGGLGTIGGVPIQYIGGGVAVLIIVAAIIFALRRR